MSRLARLTRLVGAISAIGAVLWLMRDRLVSLGAPRHPDPPHFRTSPAEGSALATEPPSDDLTEVNGIGPVYSDRLHAAGMSSFADIADSTDAALAAAAGVTESRVAGWREAARQLNDS